MEKCYTLISHSLENELCYIYQAIGSIFAIEYVI